MTTDVSGKIIAWFLLLMSLVYISLYYTSANSNRIYISYLQDSINTFVNETKHSGEITLESYEDLLSDISATSIHYKIEFQHTHRSIDPVYDEFGNFTSLTKANYYSWYTDSIVETLETVGVYKMSKEDTINVSIVNTSPTLFSNLRRIFGFGQSTIDIAVFAGGMILNEEN